MNVSGISSNNSGIGKGLSSVGNIVKNTGNVVKEVGMNVGEAVGLVKREPWYYFYLKIGAAIILLSFIGLNIFTYLKGGVDAITYFLKKVSSPIIKPITKTASKITSTVKKAVKKAPPKKKDKDLEIEKEQKPPSLPPRKKLSGKGRDIKKDNRVEEAWKLEKQGEDSDEEDCSDPEPDSDILSEIQNNRKSGWCYIGTDRGYRSCVKIGEQDQCLSGKVYQTEAICHNPNLRP